jgi:hypothetical protein
MLAFAVKVAVTALLVVAVAEIGKRSTFAAGILASLPLTSVLAMIWLYADTGDSGRIAELTTSIFWMVLASLVLFITLPLMLRAGWPFWLSLIASGALTAASYFAMVALLKRFGFAF